MTSAISLFSSLEWEDTNDFIGFTDAVVSDPGTGLFIMPSAKVYNGLALSGGADIEFASTRSVSLEWKGQFLESSDPLSPLQSLSAVFKFNKPDTAFAGTLSAGWSLDPFENLPEVGGDLSYNVGRGVFLVIEAEDILPLFSGEERTLLGSYIKPSGIITVRVKISQ